MWPILLFAFSHEHWIINKPMSKASKRRFVKTQSWVWSFFALPFLALLHLESRKKKVNQQPNTCRAVPSGERRSSVVGSPTGWERGTANGGCRSRMRTACSCLLCACSMAGCSPAAVAVVTWRARFLCTRSAARPTPQHPARRRWTAAHRHGRGHPHAWLVLG